LDGVTRGLMKASDWRVYRGFSTVLRSDVRNHSRVICQSASKSRMYLWSRYGTRL